MLKTLLKLLTTLSIRLYKWYYLEFIKKCYTLQTCANVV